MEGVNPTTPRSSGTSYPARGQGFVEKTRQVVQAEAAEAKATAEANLAGSTKVPENGGGKLVEPWEPKGTS